MLGISGIDTNDTLTQPRLYIDVYFYVFSFHVCFVSFSHIKANNAFVVFITYDKNYLKAMGPMVGSCFDWLGRLGNPPKRRVHEVRFKLPDLSECHPRIGWCLYQSTRVLRWPGWPEHGVFKETNRSGLVLLKFVSSRNIIL